MSAETIHQYEPDEPSHQRPELKLVVSQDQTLLMMHVMLEDAAGHVLSYADADRYADGRPRFFTSHEQFKAAHPATEQS